MNPPNSWIELLRTIAHDLNTPITAAKGFIELVQNTGPMTEKQARYSERALGSLQHMEQLVSMLLDVAWLDADKPLEVSECNIAEIIQKAVAMQESAASRRNVRIEVDIAEDIGVVFGDPQRLPQVVNNLLNNAIKYNREGGVVWVSARGESDEVQITVRDNGRGVSEADLPHLFDPFFRSGENTAAKIEGTGLGLAVVKGVVDKHGGKIHVESKPEEGTTFLVTLPRRPATAAPASGQSAEPAG
ncbi:MAG: HAMP domain-containing sensor histidine kinase [Chloroflexota bacterium]